MFWCFRWFHLTESFTAHFIYKTTSDGWCCMLLLLNIHALRISHPIPRLLSILHSQTISVKRIRKCLLFAVSSTWIAWMILYSYSFALFLIGNRNLNPTLMMIKPKSQTRRSTRPSFDSWRKWRKCPSTRLSIRWMKNSILTSMYVLCRLF